MTKARDFSSENEFTFEVIAHYPSEDRLRRLEGTFHIYWQEMDLDLRGIFYNLKRGKLPYIRIPSQRGILDGKECYYPAYSFPNVQKTQRFFIALRKAFKIYAEEKGF